MHLLTQNAPVALAGGSLGRRNAEFVYYGNKADQLSKTKQVQHVPMSDKLDFDGTTAVSGGISVARN